MASCVPRGGVELAYSVALLMTGQALLPMRGVSKEEPNARVE